MLRSISIMSLLLLAIETMGNRNIFWFENFNQVHSTCSPNSTPFAWSVNNVGGQGSQANDWYIFYPVENQTHSCCVLNSNPNNGALYVGYGVNNCDSALYGPVYKKGCDNTTNKRVNSPVIDCTGKSTITLDLDIMARGYYSSDYAAVLYSDDGGTNWDTLENHVLTGYCSQTMLTGFWQHRTYSLPTSANNNSNVIIAFSWKNNDDCLGTSVSVGIDNIELSIECTNTVAIIEPEYNVYCAGHAATFWAPGVTGMAYEWDFGDGRTASGYSQSLTYNHPGFYTITLVCTDSDGCSNTTSLLLTVGGFDVTSSADDTLICPYECVNFNSTVIPNNIFGTPNTYVWDFHNGTPGSSSIYSPQNCYSNAGMYHASLTISNPNTTCYRSVYIPIYVDTCGYPVLNNIIIPNSGQICKGDCINFSSDAYDATSYSWTFAGASQFTSTLANPTNICYTITGTYNVTLTITNSTGTASRITQVIVYDYPPTPLLSYNGTNIVSNMPSNSYVYQWLIYNTNTSTWEEISGQFSPILSSFNSGYTYKLRASFSFCSVESQPFYFSGP